MDVDSCCRRCMIVVAAHLLPVEVAFFAAAVAVVVLKQLSLKEAYDAIDWPVIVMIAALIPVGEALERTRTTDLIAGLLPWGTAHVPDAVALAMVLIVAMLLTPIMHHAAAVLVLGPVAASLAGNLGLKTDPFLMAVALGASCDFLTPIGHQKQHLGDGPCGISLRRFLAPWPSALAAGGCTGHAPDHVGVAGTLENQSGCETAVVSRPARQRKTSSRHPGQPNPPRQLTRPVHRLPQAIGVEWKQYAMQNDDRIKRISPPVS
jgi:hypothetical protein